MTEHPSYALCTKSHRLIYIIEQDNIGICNFAYRSITDFDFCFDRKAYPLKILKDNDYVGN